MATILEEVLEEEYARSLRSSRSLEAEIEQLPKGYLRIRYINGHKHHYLQWRDGNKVRSKYIPEKDADALQQQIEMRHRHLQALKDQKEARRMIVRALGREPS